MNLQKRSHLNFFASPDGIYIWVSVLPPRPKQTPISQSFLRMLMGVCWGLKSLPFPLYPLAQALDGLLFVNFLVEGAFSSVPFLVYACSLGLFLSVTCPRFSPQLPLAL